MLNVTYSSWIANKSYISKAMFLAQSCCCSLIWAIYIILKAVMLWARFLQYFSSCACRLPRLLEPFVWGLTIICLLCWGHRLDPVGSCVSFAKRTDRVKRAQANDSRGLSPRGRRSHKLESCLMLKACSNNRIFGHALPPSIMKQLASPP